MERKTRSFPYIENPLLIPCIFSSLQADVRGIISAIAGLKIGTLLLLYDIREDHFFFLGTSPPLNETDSGTHY